MPLRDHFHPPVEPLLSWISLHSGWATRIADRLNEAWLPPEFRAEEHTRSMGGLEIDVGTYEIPQEQPTRQTNGPSVTTVRRTYSPPKVARSVPALYPDTFEVQVLQGLTLVGAVELVSPGNKDRADERRAFAIKCAAYLYSGVSVVILDVVTARRANLHNEIARLMKWKGCKLPAAVSLYAAAYRPTRRGKKAEIDLWTEPCAVGSPLPTMPLRVTGDVFVPVEFEAAYKETCRRRRLA